jgi:hypothetical protein
VYLFSSFLPFFFFFILLLSTPISQFSYPYSHLLHSPFFSCTTIHSFPSQLLFLPLLIHSFPCLYLSLPSSPNLSPHYHSLLHTQYLLTIPTQPQPPAIPDTSTLHYNNRNTPKHTQGPQNPATPITLNPPNQSFFYTPFFLVPPLSIPHNL